MDLDKFKAKAIARLKLKEPPKDIAESLGISTAIIDEWAESIPDSELVDNVVNAVSVAGAYDLMMQNPRTEEELKSAVVNVAVAITEQIKESMADDDYDAKNGFGLKLSADTVATLYSAIFGKGTQIAILNNNNTDTSESRVVQFKDAMRD